ncbi:MAG TPA: hypothetical protein V6D17_22495 [Candidatus Obscuribacterales bacterium]
MAYENDSLEELLKRKTELEELAAFAALQGVDLSDSDRAEYIALEEEIKRRQKAAERQV